MFVSKVIFLVAATAVAYVSARPQIISAALAASGMSAPAGLISVATDTKLIKDGLNFAGNLTEYATHMVGNASDTVSHLARVGLNSTTVLGKKALEGGVKVGQQGLALAESIGKHVPGYGIAITMGAKVGTVGLDLANTVGQKGLSLAASGGDKAINGTHRIVKGSAVTINKVAQTGISLGKNVIDRVDQVQNSFTSKVNRIPGASFLLSAAKKIKSFA